MTALIPEALNEAHLARRYRRQSGRRLALLTLALALMAASVALDLAIGPSGLPLGELLHLLVSPDALTPEKKLIVWDIRLPVALMALMVGAMLGAAGAEMQTILNNPLADPFTLGISSAASFGAALAIVLKLSLVPGIGIFLISANAFVMSLLTASALYAFTRMRGVSSETMILAGIAMMFTFNALLTLMQYAATDIQLAQIVFWMMGSLMRANWTKLGVCAAVLLVVLPWFMARNWSLTALRMGDDKAASLGVNVKRLRIEMLIGISLLAATAVSLVGTIAFVGLVGPHIARMLAGEDQRFFLPLSAACGAMILSMASILSKAITPGIIYPIGMITSLIGIPFFIGMILAHRRRLWA